MQTRSKEAQAREMFARMQARNKQWIDTARNLALLLGDEKSARDDLNDMATRPLGYILGTLAHIRDHVAPSATIAATVDARNGLMISIKTEIKKLEFAMTEQDFENGADQIAIDLRQACKGTI